MKDNQNMFTGFILRNLECAEIHLCRKTKIKCDVMRYGCFVLVQKSLLKTFNRLKHASNQKSFSLDEEVFLTINRQ